MSSQAISFRFEKILAHKKAWFSKSGCLSTHPDIATLVTPLFGFAEKRGFLFLGLFTLFTPQAKRGGPAKRRPGESIVCHLFERVK